MTLRESVHGMQIIAGFVLIGVGVLGVIVSLWWRLPVRETEVW
jgi:hypothetical protein